MLTKLERSYLNSAPTFSENGGIETARRFSSSADVVMGTEEEQEAEVEAEYWAELRAVKERWMQEEGGGGVGVR